MAGEVTLALIGCGGNMNAHVRGYRALWEAGLREFRIVAVCDVERQRAVNLANDIDEFQDRRPAVYREFRDLLGTEQQLDAVDISVVHSEHHKVAIPCLEAGKHVTIEKPIAITCRAGRAVIEAAERAGVVLQVAENYRRSPEQRAIRWALRQGRIGTPRLLYWVDVRERVWYWSWREHREQAGGGWSMDGGVHFADLFRYHVGEVERLYALSRAHFPSRYRDRETRTDPVDVSVEDTTMAVLEFANGVSGEWSSTNVAPGRGFSQRALFGADGSITWGVGLDTRDESIPMEDLVQAHEVAIGEAERERLFPRGITDTVATELWEFIQAVQGKAEIETDGAEGLADLAICMALYESAHLHEPVEVARVAACEIENYQADLNEAAALL
jgi:predicted dehydrogenase